MPKVTHNGIEMDAGWARRIEESQGQPAYTADGIKYPRVRYGDENPARGEKPCSFCAAIRGQFHVTAACEFERCPKCGESLGGHTCTFDELMNLALMSEDGRYERLRAEEQESRSSPESISPDPAPAA
jgi:hypothetical protein